MRRTVGFPVNQGWIAPLRYRQLRRVNRRIIRVDR